MGWYGLRFVSAPNTSYLDYCVIEYGQATGVNPDNNGGGVYIFASNPVIQHSTIRNNHAANLGGGIYSESSGPTFGKVLIKNNSANSGGGMVIYASGTTAPQINKSVFLANTPSALRIATGNPQIYTCTSYGHPGPGYGVQADSTAQPDVRNCILWDVASYHSDGGVSPSYCDIRSGGYSSQGNITADPQFVSASNADFRLQWGSPCIDSGDPNTQYNDPDGTRADMGAFHYDQSTPLRVLLTPQNPPIQIPPGGGSFSFVIQATNIALQPLPVTAWCNIMRPDSSLWGPVLGPITLNLNSNQTIGRLRMQQVPGSALPGIYYYHAMAASGSDTSRDNFVFTKLGAGAINSGFGSWANTGEPFPGEEVRAGEIYPLSFSLYPSSPNPFNSSTTIRYELRTTRFVSLKVYDIAGRLVQTLVEEWREAGSHFVTFDGSRLAAGVYLVRLQAGEFTGVQKLVLLK